MSRNRGSQRRSGRTGNSRPYPRSARVGETLREIIAEELVRIDDERLTFISITGIDVDPELNRAIVFFDSLDGEDGDEPILAALGEHRVRLQSAIGRQIRTKKTPILSFQPDVSIRSAERIDEILRKDQVDRGQGADTSSDIEDASDIGGGAEIDTGSDIDTGRDTGTAAGAGDDAAGGSVAER